MTIDFVPICHLCDECVWSNECVLTDTFPVLDCAEFEDGGTDYPDGDVGTEWQMEVRYYQVHGA